MTEDEIRQRLRDFTGKARESLRTAEAYLTAIEDLIQAEAVTAAPHIQFREMWNTVTKDTPLAACLKLTPGRIKKVQARLKAMPLEEWPPIFARIVTSTFCCGQNTNGWLATFDWVLQPDVATKVLEGKYDNRQGKSARIVGTAAPQKNKYDNLFDGADEQGHHRSRGPGLS